MNRKSILSGVAALMSMPACLLADFIPYPNIGTEAPANFFTATATGDVTAYFYATDAGYDSVIGLKVNGVSTGVFGLPNHSSSYGQALVLGSANAGDSLEFQLAVLSSGDNWFTLPVNNSDGRNHAYATAFSGDSVIPAGIYIGFEDLPGLGDVDYNDHQFVFTNVEHTNNVPDGGSTLALAGMAAMALALSRRKLA